MAKLGSREVTYTEPDPTYPAERNLYIRTEAWIESRRVFFTLTFDFTDYIYPEVSVNW